MINLNNARIAAGIELSEIADYLGISYIFLAKIFKEQIPCSENLRRKIKIFLIKNYTKRIEKM